MPITGNIQIISKIGRVDLPRYPRALSFHVFEIHLGLEKPPPVNCAHSILMFNFFCFILVSWFTVCVLAKTHLSLYNQHYIAIIKLGATSHTLVVPCICDLFLILGTCWAGIAKKNRKKIPFESNLADILYYGTIFLDIALIYLRVSRIITLDLVIRGNETHFTLMYGGHFALFKMKVLPNKAKE